MIDDEESDFSEFYGLKAADDDQNLEIKELSSRDEIIDIYDPDEDDVKQEETEVVKSKRKQKKKRKTDVKKLKIDNEEFKLPVNKPRKNKEGPI